MLAQAVLQSSIIGAMKEKPMVNLERLQKLMNKKGWGLGELAQYSGVKYETVYSLKSGRRKNSTMDTLKRIAGALNTSVDYLLGTTEEEKPPMEQLPDAIRRIAEIASTLSRMRQEELARIAETLADLEREQLAGPLPEGNTRALMDVVDDVRRHGIPDAELLASLDRIVNGSGTSTGWSFGLDNGYDGTTQPGHNH